MSRSAARALALLETVATSGAMGLADAAAATGMPASTALRHLRALVQYGYLVRDDLGQYAVGPTFLRVALSAFRSGPFAQLTAAAQPHLEALAEATEESAYLAVRDGSNAVYIATVESSRAIRHVGWVGSSVPLAGTAVGAALLAAPLTPGESPVPQFNTGAIEPDVTAVTAPIFIPSGVAGAFSILGPTERLSGDRLATAADAVVAAARTVALSLSDPKQLSQEVPSP